VVLEIPEVLDELNTKRFTKALKKRIKVISTVGSVLVIIGMVGESVFKERSNEAEGILQSFNNTLLPDTQIRTAEANERAAEAENEAGAADQVAETDKKTLLSIGLNTERMPRPAPCSRIRSLRSINGDRDLDGSQLPQWSQRLRTGANHRRHSEVGMVILHRIRYAIQMMDGVWSEPLSRLNFLLTGTNTGKFPIFEPNLLERNSLLLWFHTIYRPLAGLRFLWGLGNCRSHIRELSFPESAAIRSTGKTDHRAGLGKWTSRRCFDWSDLGSSLFKVKLQYPHSADGLIINLRGLELPALRCLQC
jgi:hypothetical protein